MHKLFCFFKAKSIYLIWAKHCHFLNSYNTYCLDKLIVFLKKNDLKAFDEIYHRFVPKLHGFLIKIYKDKIMAEEVTQEVFIKIWENRQGIRAGNTFEGYLFKIAKNKIYDLLHLQKRKQEVYGQLKLRDYSNELEDAIIFHDLDRQVKEVVDDFPASQKEIFILSRHELLSNNEIAQKLQLSQRTVETQIYRALQKIKAQLTRNEISFILLIFNLGYFGYC
jgi:RNA polymerase sigma-70 factor (family 1)